MKANKKKFTKDKETQAAATKIVQKKITTFTITSRKQRLGNKMEVFLTKNEREKKEKSSVRVCCAICIKTALNICEAV